MKKEDIVISSTKQGIVVAIDSAGNFQELLAKLRIRLKDSPAEDWSSEGQVMVDLGSRDVSKVEMTALESLFFEHGLFLKRLISRPDLPLEKIKSAAASSKGNAKGKSGQIVKDSPKAKTAVRPGISGAEVIQIKGLPAKTDPVQTFSESTRSIGLNGLAKPTESNRQEVNQEVAATTKVKTINEIPADNRETANHNNLPSLEGPIAEHGMSLGASEEIKRVTKNTIDQSDTLLVQRSLRSGQSIHHTGSVVIMGDVNPGAEVTAGGNIVVMGSFRGVAHAGARGDESATITAFRLRPTQLRIAGHITRPPDGEQGGPEVTETARIREGIVVIERY